MSLLLFRLCLIVPFVRPRKVDRKMSETRELLGIAFAMLIIPRQARYYLTRLRNYGAEVRKGTARRIEVMLSMEYDNIYLESHAQSVETFDSEERLLYILHFSERDSEEALRLSG